MYAYSAIQDRSESSGHFIVFSSIEVLDPQAL